MSAICQHFVSLVLNLIQRTSSSVTGTISPEICILFSKDLNLGIFHERGLVCDSPGVLEKQSCDFSFTLRPVTVMPEVWVFLTASSSAAPAGYPAV